MKPERKIAEKALKIFTSTFPIYNEKIHMDRFSPYCFRVWSFDSEEETLAEMFFKNTNAKILTADHLPASPVPSFLGKYIKNAEALVIECPDNRFIKAITNNLHTTLNIREIKEGLYDRA